MYREQFLRRIFAAGVDSVRPQTILRSRELVKVVADTEIHVWNGDKRITIDLPARTHVIGFGKGVFGLALEMERILGDHLVSGQINVPINTLKTNAAQLKTIKVVEAAANNYPDEAAVDAARKMKEFAGTLTDEDVLFVLITGGGSALLPLPCPGITLDDKLDVITKLVRKGATINELNAVRIQLSDIKGGQLARAAKGARKVIAFIISDIVHDPIELIASGPTVKCTNGINQAQKAVDILRTHNLWPAALSDSVRQAIEARVNTTGDSNVNNSTNKGGNQILTGAVGGEGNVENILIANNDLAVDGCLREISSLATNPLSTTGVYLSNAVVGNVSSVAEAYFRSGRAIKEAKQNNRSIVEGELGATLMATLAIKDESRFIADLNRALSSAGGRADICLVAGGETTVQLRCEGGKGGRNQQMVLEFMQMCHDEGVDGIYLLSAGTDGIDGPTDAAGAIGSLEILEEQFTREELDRMGEMIANKDSYNFFKSKPCHVVIGHTGTNVMDIQLLMVCGE